MAKNFYSMITRLQKEGSLDYNLDRGMLGRDVEEEKQDIEEERSLYRSRVDDWELKNKEKGRHRALRGLGGTLFGAAMGAFGPVGYLGGALIGGLASSLGRSSVEPYGKQIQNTLPGGKFHMQARKDYGRDIASTNAFIMDAKEGQSMLNLTDSLNDALNIWTGLNAYGGDLPGGGFGKGKGTTLYEDIDWNALNRYNTSLG